MFSCSMFSHSPCDAHSCWIADSIIIQPKTKTSSFCIFKFCWVNIRVVWEIAVKKSCNCYDSAAHIWCGQYCSRTIVIYDVHSAVMEIFFFFLLVYKRLVRAQVRTAIIMHSAHCFFSCGFYFPICRLHHCTAYMCVLVYSIPLLVCAAIKSVKVSPMLVVKKKKKNISKRSTSQ